MDDETNNISEDYNNFKISVEEIEEIFSYACGWNHGNVNSVLI